MRIHYLLMALVLMPFVLSACDSDLPPPQRHPGDRAVSSNLSENEPDHEYLAPAPDAVPLVRVDLPNNSNETPKVTTIVDVVHTTLNPPVTPATPPPTTPIAGQPAFIERGSPDTTAPPAGTQP